MESVAYIRVSTEEQGRRISPEAQEEIVRDFARSQGYEIVRVFRDIGVSGSLPLSQRPAFQELLDYCNRNNIRTIFALSLDRLTRNIEDKVYLATLTSRYGFKIITVYDREISIDRLFLDESLEFRQTFDKLYRKYVRRNVREKFHKKYKTGSPISSLKDRDPIELVEKIASLRRRGLSIREIAENVRLSYKLTRFILYLLGMYKIDSSTCPRCGSRRTRADPDFPGFRYCDNCGLLYPENYDEWRNILNFSEELKNMLFEEYIIKIIQHVLSRDLSRSESSHESQTSQV